MLTLHCHCAWKSWIQGSGFCPDRCLSHKKMKEDGLCLPKVWVLFCWLQALIIVQEPNRSRMDLTSQYFTPMNNLSTKSSKYFTSSTGRKYSVLCNVHFDCISHHQCCLAFRCFLYGAGYEVTLSMFYHSSN